MPALAVNATYATQEAANFIDRHNSEKVFTFWLTKVLCAKLVRYNTENALNVTNTESFDIWRYSYNVSAAHPYDNMHKADIIRKVEFTPILPNVFAFCTNIPYK